MDPVFTVIAVLGAVGAVVEYRRRMKRSGQLIALPDGSLPYGDTQGSEEAFGFLVTHQRIHMGVEQRSGAQGGVIDLWRNTTTIRGALPEWVAFGWTVDGHRVEPDSRNTLWVDLIFGAGPDLPEGGVVYASRGDLVYDSVIDAAPPPSRFLVRGASRFLRDQPDIAKALEAYVEGGPPAAAVAFRILARAFPDRSVAERLAARHRASDDTFLAAEVAAFELPSSRARVVAMIGGDAPVAARTTLLEALVERRDGEGLAAIQPERVPPGSVATYLEALRDTRPPEAEAIALHFLAKDTESRAAVDVLATVGGLASIALLLEKQAAGLDRDGALGLDVTIELVRARIAATRGDAVAGGLAIAGGEDAGGLSITAGEGGLAIAGGGDDGGLSLARSEGGIAEDE